MSSPMMIKMFGRDAASARHCSKTASMHGNRMKLDRSIDCEFDFMTVSTLNTDRTEKCVTEKWESLVRCVLLLLLAFFSFLAGRFLELRVQVFEYRCLLLLQPGFVSFAAGSHVLVHIQGFTLT